MSICPTCGNEFKPKRGAYKKGVKSGPTKFCSVRCIRTSKPMDEAKVVLAIERYEEGFGVGLCAREFGLSKGSLSGRFRKLGLIQKGRRGHLTKHHPLHKQPDTSIDVALRDAFLQEQSSLIRQERLHWANHIAAIRWQWSINIKKQLEKNPSLKIRARLRTRIRNAIYNNPGNVRQRVRKAHKTTELLGCTIQFFKDYIQQRFTTGMSWSNYGLWHLDHVLPCDGFDLSKVREQRKCFHYSNLQPLWGTENIVKSNKVMRQQDLLSIPICAI
jgi:hypothetical protein